MRVGSLLTKFGGILRRVAMVESGICRDGLLYVDYCTSGALHLAPCLEPSDGPRPPRHRSACSEITIGIMTTRVVLNCSAALNTIFAGRIPGDRDYELKIYPSSSFPSMLRAEAKNLSKRKAQTLLMISDRSVRPQDCST